jgi:hypothetical protein
MREESMNGCSTRWLTGGEWSAPAYLDGGGKVTQKGRKLRPSGAFIAGGERGSWWRAHTSVSTTDVEVVQRQ